MRLGGQIKLSLVGYLYIVCKVLLKSCTDSITVVWAVILTCLRRHPNSRPGWVQKGETSNLSDNPYTSWLFQSVLKHHYTWESFCIQKSHWNQGKHATKGISRVVWATWTTETHALVLRKSGCPVAAKVNLWLLCGTPSGMLCHACKAHAVNVQIWWGFLHQCCASNSHQLLIQLNPGMMWADW